MCPVFSGCENTAVWKLRIKSCVRLWNNIHIQGVSGGIVDIF